MLNNDLDFKFHHIHRQGQILDPPLVPIILRGTRVANPRLVLWLFYMPIICKPSFPLHLKAIDVYMATCLTFVFAGLVEFAWVNVLMRNEGKQKCPTPTEEDKQEEKADVKKNGSEKSAHVNIIYVKRKKTNVKQ